LVNHVRTLLLNRDGAGPPVGSWDEYTPADYKAAKLSPPFLAVQDALLGIGVDRRTACWRLNGVMTAIHASSLASWAVTDDPRLSYDPESPQTAPMTGVEASVEPLNNAPDADLYGKSAMQGGIPGSASWLVSLLVKTGGGSEAAFDVAPFDAWLPPRSEWSSSFSVASPSRGPVTIAAEAAPGGGYPVELKGGLTLKVPAEAPSRSLWVVRSFVPPSDGPVECLSRVEQCGGITATMSGPVRR
jgi:hypothetical protein